MAKKRKRLSVTQQIMNDAIKNLEAVKHNSTRKQYIRDFRKYVDFCRKEYGAKTLEDTKKYIQIYADDLLAKGFTPSSIHTYLSAVCKVLNVPLSLIDKPKRYCNSFVRGRFPEKAVHRRNDLFSPKHRRLYLFQLNVGIRRAEIDKLRGDDLIEIKGEYYIRVKRGKGNKFQLQKIADAELVKTYFEGKGPNDRIFTKEELSNDLNLHYLRSQSAKNYYFDILNKCNTDDAFREKLRQEVIERWNTYNINKSTGKPKYLSPDKLEGKIYLRGKSRQMALEAGRPICYDRLCTLATSIFKLSHFRTGVVIVNYLNI